VHAIKVNGGGEKHLHSFLTSPLGGGEWFVYYNIYVVGYEMGGLGS
jgi:hypothetical protein